MAKHELPQQFGTTQRRISLGDRALIAIAAHLEVRSVLRADPHLRAHGLNDILIGSYARRVSIWPGKDVDVFGRLSDTTDTITPGDAYDMFGSALHRFDDQGRLTPQPRSFKIDFSPERLPGEQHIRAAAAEYRWASVRVERVLSQRQELGFEFSVDVVPAVGWNGHYGIPEIGRHAATGERYRTGQWRLTDPVELTERTQRRNRAPLIGGIGAYVRTVKAIKQVKAHHLPNTKPSSLFYEFILYEGFENGSIDGDSWADITASALSHIASRMRTLDSQPVCDPVLGHRYEPMPSSAELSAATQVLEAVASTASRAVRESSLCQAAIYWRQVFGGNQCFDDVFPLPDGCRGTGAAMGAAAVNTAIGGTAERSFGAT